jgi:TetR/AcrR family transcriptional regulator, cholesterol catabolism regulator
MSTRRGEILAIAGELFVQKGFDATTVREIAEAAGILSGSIYHHFDSKESMVDEILSGFLDQSLAGYRAVVAAADDPMDAVRDLVRGAFAAVADNRMAVAVMQNEFQFLVRDPRFAYLRRAADEAEDLWVRVLSDGMRSGAFRDDLDARVVYRFLRDAIWVSVRWYRPEGELSMQEITDAFLRMTLDGVTTTSRRSRRR